MSNLTPFLARNQLFAASGAHEGLSPIPNHQLIVVTCMDGRVDPAHVLGVELGDALVIRNAGGRVTQDVLQEVAFVGAVTEMMLGDDAPPFDVIVLHHTGCGSGLLADPGFRATLGAITGVDDQAMADAAVTDPIKTITHDIELLASSPLVPSRARAAGYLYDVETGLVTSVEP